MLSVNAILSEDRFSKRVGQGEVGGCTPLADSAWRPLQLPVEKALVNARWTICLLSCTNRRRKRSFHLVETPFHAAFSPEEYSVVGGALTIERSPRSGCG